VTVIETNGGRADARVIQIPATGGLAGLRTKPSAVSIPADGDRYWTKLGDVYFGRIARWESGGPGGPWVQVQVGDGPRRWAGKGDVVGNFTIGNIDIESGRVAFRDNRIGESNVLQVYSPNQEPKAGAPPPPAPNATAAAPKAPGPAPTVDGYAFRRITRWKDSDPRVEVELANGRHRWYEIGDAFENIEIADIDIVANEVTILRGGEGRTLKLAQAPMGGTPPKRPATSEAKKERNWQPVEFNGVKFWRIARWEDSDPRVEVNSRTANGNGWRKAASWATSRLRASIF
jgi:hypothetical protein